MYADSRFYTNQPFTYAARTIESSIGNYEYPPVAQALKKLLDLPDPPTAIFVTNNQMTLGAIHTISECVLNCPEDISLISFDDHEWAPFHSPPLTVIRQPTYKQGQMAAQLLIKLIKKEESAPPTLLPVELIGRGSELRR